MRKIRKSTVALLIILAGMIVGAVVYFAFYIKNVTVTGSERHTEEEIRNYIFEKEMDYHTAVFFLKTTFGSKKSIPFVEDYEISFQSPSSVSITIYEKSLIGYVEYMGTYFYLDKDGIAVESSGEVLEGVPYVTGLAFDYIILQEQLPVTNEDTFDVLLEIAQLLLKYGISVDKIHIGEDLSLTLYIGDVRVAMGNDDMLAEKAAELADIEPSLSGYSGVLDMTEYKEDHSGYILKSDYVIGNDSSEEDGSEEGGTEEGGDPGDNTEKETEMETPEVETDNREEMTDEIGLDYMDQE